ETPSTSSRHAWGFPLVSVLRQLPTLRKDVAHGTCQRLKTLPRGCGFDFDGVVENQVSLVKRLVRPRKLDGTAAVLPEEFRRTVGCLCDLRGRHFLGGHFGFLSSFVERGRELGSSGFCASFRFPVAGLFLAVREALQQQEVKNLILPGGRGRRELPPRQLSEVDFQQAFFDFLSHRPSRG